MKSNYKTFSAVIILALTFNTGLFAEQPTPKPKTPERAQSSGLDRESHSLAIADFQEIRFSTPGGGITFRVGDVNYVWRPDGGSEASLVYAGAAVLAELRLAQKVAVRGWLYTDGGRKRYHIRDMDLLYDSLK